MEIPQTFDMGDITRALYGKLKVLWNFVVPSLETVGGLRSVKRAIDLEGVEYLRGECELILLGEVIRIKCAAPFPVYPSRKADADVPRLGGFSWHTLLPLDESNDCWPPVFLKVFRKTWNVVECKRKGPRNAALFTLVIRCV